MRRAWIASAAAPGLGKRTFIGWLEEPPTVAVLLGICHVDDRSQQQHHQDAVKRTLQPKLRAERDRGVPAALRAAII